MNASSVGTGEKIAAGAAVALFIVLFLPWYGVSADVGAVSFSQNATAWQAFSFIDILLFLVSAVVIGVVAAKAAGALPELPAPPGTIILGAGGLALLLILFRIIDLPGGDVPSSVDLGRKIGVFLGLICAAAITYGGWTSSQGAAAGPGGGGTAAPPPPTGPTA